jgi:DNA-binding response OmpR family regulator
VFFDQKKYDLAILDLNLPFINGMELCRMIRQQNTHMPIIMLTALGELTNKLEAFTLGADDYIIKPFHFSELVARIQVFLKRRQALIAQENITIADLVIDFAAKNVVRGGKNIALTAKEFALLSLLAQNQGRILSKQEIAEKVWETDFDTGTNTIEVYINFLRNKIDKNFEPKLIHTKLGFGYYLKA